MFFLRVLGCFSREGLGLFFVWEGGEGDREKVATVALNSLKMLKSFRFHEFWCIQLYLLSIPI